VPLGNSTNYNNQALAVYQEAMPGYEIIGVSAGSANWYNTDALHCRTHGFADRNAIFIKHYPKFSTIETDLPVEISAEVYSYAGNDLTEGFPKLFYKFTESDDSVYHEVTMTETKSNTFTAFVPSYYGTNQISYYITAEDIDENKRNQPIMKEHDPHIFFIENNTIVSVNQITQNREKIRVFPNPNDGNFNLNIKLNEASNVIVEIQSITGQVTYSQPFLLKNNSNNIHISTNNLQTGVYILNVKSEKNNMSTKLIIK